MLKHFDKVEDKNEAPAQVFTHSLIRVYTTQAECARDVFEFAKKLNDKIGQWVAMDIENLVDGVCSVSFFVTEQNFNKITTDLIKESIDEVADAQDMNENMTVENYTVPADWFKKGSYFDVAPSKVSNIVKNYKRVSSVKFAELYDDVFDTSTL